MLFRSAVVCPGFVTTPMTAHNDFVMPLLMSAEESAIRIRDGLARGKSRIAFPWPMALCAWLLGALPVGLGNRILAGSPGKAPFGDERS